jgi:glycosyltransferase involved in cell wall biosynthesis
MVYQDFDRWLARCLPHWQREAHLDAVYCYEDGALETFKAAHALQLRCAYDLPIAYWETGRRLMTEEAHRLPSWASTLGGGVVDSLRKLERKTQELALADIIVCPSKFVLDSLPGWAKEKVVVLAPFGSPIAKGGQSREEKAVRATPKLRVLFAGSMGQRKGLGDLFEAIRRLNRSDVELVTMGSLLAPIQFYRDELPDFIYEAGRPHDQVLALMRSCDVLCLPSIVEGRALVMQEAMSQELPLIITPNTGGADLIEEGQTGFLVPIRRPDLIAEKIAWYADHRSETREMGRAARVKASSFTWKAYSKTVVGAMRGSAQPPV